MPANAQMLERSAELKRALVEFAQDPRFAEALHEVLDERLAELTVQTEEDAIDAVDRFLLQDELPDGRTLLDCFIEEHHELSAADRAILEGWSDVVEGIFEVRRRDNDALIVHNLVDDLTYRIRTNANSRIFDRTPRGSFLVMRIVPIADEWLISGTLTPLPRQDRDLVRGLAAELIQHEPQLLFRNPEKLEQAWELQRIQRQQFIDFFGADLVVVAGKELAKRFRDFIRYQAYEVKGGEGRTAANETRQRDGSEPTLPEPQLPEELSSATTVAMVYDEVDGLSFLPEYGLVQETFATPELIVDRRHREIVETYLEEPGISPRVLERLVAQDETRANLVLRQLLARPDLRWERDGEALLRRVKAGYYARPLLPAVLPVSEALSGLGASSPAGRKVDTDDKARRGKAGKRRRR
jgi:hypothetical protein